MAPLKYDNQGDALSREVPPDALALIDAGGNGSERRYSYSDLLRMSGAVARALQRRGLERGDRVAILSANRAEYLFAFFGAMQAGLVAVPVNWKLPSDTVGFVIGDSDARLVICDRQRLALTPDGVPKISYDGDFEGFLASGIEPEPFRALPMRPEEPAMFLYTSGSTGRPKGVVLSHYSHLWVVSQRLRRPGPFGHRVLVAAPLYHMNGLAMCQAIFSHGDTIVLLPQFTTRRYVEAAARHRVAQLTSVPTMIAMLLRERELLAAHDLGAVEGVRMGSAPITQALIDQVRSVFPKAQITNGYGTTEAGPVVFGPHPKGLRQPDLSTGYAHPEVQLRLVRDGRVVEDEGALEMKCGGVMTHYHKLPETTAQVMTTDGYYRTSDVFRRDADGFYFFVGRVDDMFVSGGENIYPGEVEKMLERHPGIHQAAVLPVPDDLKGHKPVAFVVRAPGTELDEQAVKDFALANAPAYQHPRRVFFINEMPLAGTNKKAAVVRTHGGPERIAFETDFPDPTPGEGDVILAVKACSLNYHDVFTRRGMPGIKVPMPIIMGLDVAGEIVEVGPDVTSWKKGDRVLVDPINRIEGGLMGETVHGGLAELCRVRAHQLIRIPEGVNFADAAALPVAYGTSLRMMTTNGHVAKGERVLILGASGGVGVCCVQLAKLAGAEVVACAGTDAKAKRLIELGADHTINYVTHDFQQEVYKLYGKPARRGAGSGRGVDVVVNYTGGDTWVKSLKVLKVGGRLLTCGATAGFDPKEDIRFIWTFELKVLGSNGWQRDTIETLLGMVRDGRLKAVIDRVFPLQEAREALRLLEDREVFGKVVVAP